eukprot:628502-Pelagomonas_calceolata.AAC.1
MFRTKLRQPTTLIRILLLTPSTELVPCRKEWSNITALSLRHPSLLPQLPQSETGSLPHAFPAAATLVPPTHSMQEMILGTWYIMNRKLRKLPVAMHAA